MNEMTTGEFLDHHECTFRQFEVWAHKTGSYQARDALDRFLSMVLEREERKRDVLAARADSEKFGESA